MHRPVMVNEVVRNLNLEKGGVYIDCTLGTGGHSLEIMKNTNGILIGMDLDLEQVKLARDRINGKERRFFPVVANYRYLNKLIKVKVNGILIDSGLSSYQLEDKGRGFSFRSNGPLDMRFNHSGMTAKEVIEKKSTEELASILRNYGNLRSAFGIAKIIKKADPEDVESLVHLLRRTFRKEKAHKEIAKVFQALRIYVNKELDNLSEVMNAAYSILSPGGRLVIIIYHSGEGKVVVKRARELGIKFVYKKSLKPTKEEFMENPRSRSARLRVFEK